MAFEPLRITVVIPTLNDAEALEAILIRLKDIGGVGEIRVSDGGSVDRTREVAYASGAIWVESERGRGAQMNSGAQSCSGEVLWFLHADNVPRLESFHVLQEALKDLDVVGGAFRFQLCEPRWYGPLFHFFIGLRSRILKLPFGDQGYFVRKKVFERMGGFSNVPILEDVDFIRRLGKAGRIVLLRTPIGVSPRRWDREGVFKRTCLNWAILLGFSMGIGPERLARFYRQTLSGD